MPSSPLRALGLMSGTSLDGVDVALIETDGERIGAFGPSLTVPYDDEVRRTVRAAFGAGQPSEATRAAERAVTAAHVAAVRRWASERGIPLSSVDLVGFHGQTITHRPENRFTWQIGDGAALARELGVRVVNDLRAADVAAGGQGAPLVPIYHAALAADLPRPLAVVNVGGVGNVTWIGPDGALLAFDTGPGNGPIDDWCARRAGQRYDKDGALAAAGKVDRGRLQRFAEHRFFSKVPPKSLDRGDFNDVWADGLSVADGTATLTWGTARAIALAARHFPAPVSRWVICGGGARNPTLLRAIAEETAAKVLTAADLGWDGDALEAQAFAFLAVRSLRGLPLTFPGTTGAPRPMTGGRLNEP
ncbi:anhydro-N-acetylmuramic acid kinase [Reyranella sp.]|jgi:anhydro-N-acetylmuramic acid kinase|uniref:anhydro-N-acetylmuramic acid kinase n=1 Tax=Reyranella sp. TaxID=1929291 RepID=UPI000BCE4969|nr:anhydro-N-acetylmuramic acid kinase [Reyranella sp.]OYY35632.1 MAG: anhydro-N-acetylmuramic acid kinase [Rhodospirillales bacterium 35-66-84]OYZ91502.1 MAG: anhydro-N-acetylmuramic acid kinase [Rhodospirillales bacterium 24-66-33]OZB22039.1 MAG: anhydro-N-acetylmuramic acid kinase [Rhodospirillales bacterium 39-66-50]HQS14939.1 anhydro-N-acetylmuramic acid kinase [Reyranella sp.]HQT10748.1 anhydro-N-acetylmuramic acid kinase [Reyranella sp.]